MYVKLQAGAWML